MNTRNLVPIGLLLASFTFAGCEIEKTADGELPDVDVDVDGGKLPEYDVDAPDIDVRMEERTVKVPDVDITPAGEQDLEEELEDEPAE